MNAMTTSLDRAGRLASQTPSDRNRYVDLLRALSIMIVVFGHWLMAAPEMTDNGLRVGHMIADNRWAQWLTWLLQVMPIFFFVGGYSNRVGWRSARQRHITYGRWLADRLRRLTFPIVPLLGLWIPAAWVAWKMGVDPSLVTIGSQAALVPVWFLATYVLIVMATPLTVALWDRLGFGAFVLLTGLAAATDLLSIGVGIDIVKWLNYIFVWNAVHMLGYVWADGRLQAIRARVAMAIGGIVTLATLVAVGPYPLAMVGLDGAAITNSNPPRVTLVALAMFQFGLAMVFEARARRWLNDLQNWTVVVAVNGSIMSLYLWHLTVMVAVLGLSVALGGAGLAIPPGSLGWWLTRPLWLALLAGLTVAVMARVGRFERPAPLGVERPPLWRPALGVFGLCAGLGLLARYGIADSDGLNTTALWLTIGGLAVGGVLDRGSKSNGVQDPAVTG